MSAMWTQLPGVNNEQYGYNADIRESASVAHIYGQNLVAAESLTASFGAWSWSPETLKPTADKELAMGLNRFVIHTSVHQPVNDKIPGLGLGPFGQWFTRHETWAELAKPWTTYLARSSYMLQQGKFVADVIYYYGEDSNVTAIFAAKSPDVPAGYNFDYVNADALKNRLSVENGRIVTATGMSYRVLALDPYSQHMSLPVLKKIRDLVNAGAVVVGPKPVGSPSLSDDQAEFQTIADQVFGSGTGERTVGKGKVYAGQTLAQALPALGVAPDFDFTRPEADTNLLFVHRKVADGEIYWVDSRNKSAETVDATFRVTGKAPELWHADTGEIEPASYLVANGHTVVPLRLDSYEAVFVVFRKAAAAPSRVLPEPVETTITTVEGPWEISFQPNRGAPAKIGLDKLSFVVGKRGCRREVFLRHGNLLEEYPGARRLVQDRRATVAGPRRCQEPRGSLGQRQAPRHRLEAAVPCECDRRVEAGREQRGNQGDRPVGQPADWRPAARRRQEIHLHRAAVLSGRLAPVALRASGTGEARTVLDQPGQGSVRVGHRRVAFPAPPKPTALIQEPIVPALPGGLPTAWMFARSHNCSSLSTAQAIW